MLQEASDDLSESNYDEFEILHEHPNGNEQVISPRRVVTWRRKIYNIPLRLVKYYNTLSQKFMQEHSATNTLDNYEDKQNPAYVPRLGLFYWHDLRNEDFDENAENER